MSPKVEEIRALEKKLEILLNNWKSSLYIQLDKQVSCNEEVKILSENPCIIQIPANLLFSTGNWNPSTYIPRIQLEAVKSVIEPCRTITECVEKLSKLLQEKRIKNKYGDVCLNDNTLKVLEDCHSACYFEEL